MAKNKEGQEKDDEEYKDNDYDISDDKDNSELLK